MGWRNGHTMFINPRKWIDSYMEEVALTHSMSQEDATNVRAVLSGFFDYVEAQKPLKEPKE